MNFTLSSWAIRNPIPPIVLFLVLTVAGLFAYQQLPINNMPSVVVPVVNISITQPGASPSEIESQITRKVEGAIAGLQGVKHIVSTISEGNSNTTVEFYLETNFDRALNDSRDAVSNIRDQLPRTILEPIIQRLEIDGGSILIYTISAPEMRTEELSWYVDDTLSRELLAIRGVAKVERNGGIDHEITISLNPAKLESFGITASDISRQLTVNNIDLPGGRIVLDGTEHTIRTLGGATSVDVLRNTRIPTSTGRMVRLSDIADVTDGGAEMRDSTKLDGKEVVSFQVYRSKGSSEVTVARLVEAKLTALEKKHPNIHFTQLFSVAEFTERTFLSTVYTFFEGTILTIIVVYFFLRDWRATVLAAIAIPLSIIPTFLIMSWMGFTLNGVSLLAISLVTGVLVDDAIVEIENIYRHMKAGKTPYEASMIAADEIGLAVVATTFVICAVFLPVSFMGGISGQFFKQFGLPVAMAAFFSLMVARLLTPLLAAYWFKPVEDQHHHGPSRMLMRYRHMVEWTLDNRLKTLGIAFITLIGSFALIPFLSSGFIPYDDLSQSKLMIELPRGTSITETNQFAQNIAQTLRKRPEVMYVLTSISDDQASGGVNKATLTIKLVPADERKLDQRAFENDILPDLRKLPDARIGFANNAGVKDVSIALVGENSKTLNKAAEELERAMRAMPELQSVTSTAGQKQPEIIITPDYERASQLGITVEQISDAVRIATIGDNVTSLAKFSYGSRQIPIRVRMPEMNVPDTHIIENLRIPTQTGATVPLKTVADITYGSGPTTIERYDRQRKIAIEGNLNGIPLGTAIEKIHALPVIKNLPADVQVLNTGDAEVMAELFAGFASAIGAGLMMVYAIQVLLYKDWLQPLTRMTALPLSIGGAFLALLVTGTDMNLPATIGILMLMGIADKNSILLVDYMLELMRQGMDRRHAIIHACLTRSRPIIMTSLAMLAGMFPIAMGIGMDTAFRAPMAIAVIGGLISSTALSLIFVPVLFSYVRDFETWLAPKLKRLLM